VEQTPEQIRIMGLFEYVTATGWVWVVFWPVSFLELMAVSYGAPSVFRLDASEGQGGLRGEPNRRSNPAADRRQTTLAPPAAIVPIKVINSKSD
jgi:hypothetical protein